MKPREDVTQQIVPENAPEIRKAQQPPASNAFVPPVAGLIMVSAVVKDLLEIGAKKKIKYDGYPWKVGIFFFAYLSYIE